MNKFFTFLFLLISSGLLAQDWEVVAEDIDYKIEEGHIICKSTQGFDYDYRVLKYTNLANQELELAFNFERWYNEDFCEACGEGDHNTMRSITIPANSSIEGSCGSSADYLKIFDHTETRDTKAWASKLTKVVVNKLNSTKN
jgi:hypothetical protein